MLNKHLVKNYRDILLEVDYVPFTKDMIRMYDEGEGQLHESVTESTSMVYAKEGKRTFSETLETTKVSTSEETTTFKKAMEKITSAPPPSFIKEDVLGTEF